MGSQGTEGASGRIVPPSSWRIARGTASTGCMKQSDSASHSSRPTSAFPRTARIRHLKTVGALLETLGARLGDRRSLTLSELLRSSAGTTELMLDLKGSNVRGAEPAQKMDPPARVHDVRPLVGAARRLRRASRPLLRISREPSPAGRGLRRFADTGVDGVSIHERLLDARVVADLRSGLVLTWPVNMLRYARRSSCAWESTGSSSRPQASANAAAPA